LNITFSPDNDSVFLVQRFGQQHYLSAYSAQHGDRLGSWDIFGDWPIYAVHDMRISSDRLQLLAVTTDELLGYVEIPVHSPQLFRRRYLASLSGRLLHAGAKFYVFFDHTATEERARIFWCRNQQIDAVERVDPNTKEATSKPAVILVPESGWGEWVMAAPSSA
jgi:hypothetical protein